LAQDNEADLKQLKVKKQELLTINKEMSELIVQLQNDICLAEAKVSGNKNKKDFIKSSTCPG